MDLTKNMLIEGIQAFPCHHLIKWIETTQTITFGKATSTSLKKWICVLSVFIAIIPTYLLCQMYANPPNLNSKGPYLSSESEIKFRRCLFTFSIKHEIR